MGVWRRAGALRLVAAFAVVGLLALALLAWVTLTLSDRAVREQAEARVQSTSSAAADLVHQQLRGLGGVVEIVSRRPTVIDALAARQTDSPELLRAARDIRSTLNVESAAVFDATGHLLAADPPPAGVPLGTDLSFRDWFAGARRSSGHYISEAFLSRATPPQQLVTASAAVRDGSNRIVGVVTASLTLPTLQRHFDAFARSQHVQLQVTDQRGVVISGPAYRGSLEIDRNDDVTEALVGQTTLARSGEDLRASAPVPGIGWTVTAIAPTSRVDAPITELRHGVLAIAGLLAVAMVGGLTLMTWAVRRGQRAERVAAAAETRQRLLLESTGDGVIGVDGDGRCTFANPAAARLLGAPSPEALLGEDVHACIREVEDMVEWDSHPLVEDGETTGEVITVRDLSERRRAERELAAARDAALEASRMKSAFLANMSHEIRTPLNGVIGMTSLLADMPLDERQREYVETIRTSSDALLDVINDILDFSKIEAGRLDIEELDYDVREVVEQVADMLAPSAHRKGVELILDIRDDVPEAVRGDAGRVRQVVTNLLSNAVKFTDEGTITVTVQRSDGPPPTLLFEVADTGIGIDEARAEQLFEAFTQADVSTTRRYGGSGLGLTISRQLVELMGGTIGVDSEPGRGSRFWFRLPLTLADALPAVRPRADLQGVKALIVDDNEINRRVLGDMVKRWGITTEAVESPFDAVGRVQEAAARGEPFDLALLDYHMPGMDGVRLARRLRDEPAAADTRLVMLTSSAGREEASAATDAGIVGFVTKPIRRGALYSLLAKAMSRNLPTSAGGGEPVMDRAAPRRLLVVEDNPINQRVAVSMLEKYGHHVDVAANGVEALAAMAEVDYDVVFMDVQMPEMDGYDATIELRRRERARGHRRTAIVALTAGATRDDLERCLASGMDDVVTKPVTEEELLSAVTRWAENADVADKADVAGSTGDSAAPEAVTTTPTIDGDALDSLVAIDPDGSKGVLARLAASFLADARTRVAELRSAVASRDAQVVRRAAHRLKGSALYFGATGVTNACRELEARGESGDVSDCEGAVDRLAGEVEALDGVLLEEITRRQREGVARA